MSSHKYDHVHHSKTRIITDNFLGGIAWGVGATIGLSIVLALLGLLGNAIGFVPIVGDFVSQVIDYINQNNSNFR